jgi:hypothetical protein
MRSWSVAIRLQRGESQKCGLPMNAISAATIAISRIMVRSRIRVMFGPYREPLRDSVLTNAFVAKVRRAPHPGGLLIVADATVQEQSFLQYSNTRIFRLPLGSNPYIGGSLIGECL